MGEIDLSVVCTSLKVEFYSENRAVRNLLEGRRGAYIWSLMMRRYAGLTAFDLSGLETGV